MGIPNHIRITIDQAPIETVRIQAYIATLFIAICRRRLESRSKEILHDLHF